MIDFSKAQIFLASTRRLTEKAGFRSYRTFRFDDHLDGSSSGLESLRLLNDDTLAAQHSMQVTVEENTLVVVLPLVGALRCSINTGDDHIVEPGQARLLFLPSGNSVTFSNPYEDDLINYLQLWFKCADGVKYKSDLITFDIVHGSNRLISLLPAHKFRTQTGDFTTLSIGKFAGRKEVIYNLRSKESGACVFVLQGAFEVQYRLLEARDGLTLWNLDKIEIEALANDSIILIIE